jgi:hypothetical protein
LTIICKNYTDFLIKKSSWNYYSGFGSDLAKKVPDLTESESTTTTLTTIKRKVVTQHFACRIWRSQQNKKDIDVTHF